MMLAEAGILKGRPAITHHSAIEDLKGFGADVREGARFVDDGDIMTAAGCDLRASTWRCTSSRTTLGEHAARAEAAEIEWAQAVSTPG